ncbi:MAG: restriction endonuclease [Candidatus Taylorbacteria bacterium]|nr:restriction endonuclease [Candidatus Taylorbacteria bacterium]
MKTIAKELEDWFKERPKWLQDAARRLVLNETLTQADIDELVSICVAEAIKETVTFSGLPSDALNAIDSTIPLRLDSISKVQGINALSPRIPLDFGKAPLCIVYGRNGAGKSGYVRLLKHVCGARHPGALLTDIFKDGPQAQTATFTFTENAIGKSSQWSGKALSELLGTDIFDTACGYVYVNSENEVAFEPWLLRLFTRLTGVCESVGGLIQTQIRVNVSKLPVFPHEFSTTTAAAWYKSITAATTTVGVDSAAKWTTADNKELTDINKRLSEADPAAKASKVNRQIETTIKLLQSLKQLSDGFSEEKCTEYLEAKNDAIAKRKAANEDANKVFEKAPLAGVGSKSWQLLWEAARAYSTEHAYPGADFPNIADDTRCVLCQQHLDPEGCDRHQSFETFIKGELQKLARKAEQLTQSLEAEFPNIPTTDALALTMDAVAILEKADRASIVEFVSAIINRKSSCLTAFKISEVSSLPKRSYLMPIAQAARSLSKEARGYEKDAKSENRPALEQTRKNLAARKWMHEQRTAIDAEILRLSKVKKLEAASALTNTAALSRKKSTLADELITKAYTQRFTTELLALKAHRIPVHLKKTRTDVGHVYHQLFLKDCRNKNAKTSDVLSEGECRIISLAAFLADTEGRGAKTPFVFDDPISSLDQVYEEATAKRLVELSKNRQVIVFTHRLSLIGLLEKYTDKEKIEKTIVCLSKSRKGDIADLPITLTKTKQTGRRFLNERLGAARTALEAGDVQYEQEAKALCRDIRILLEQVVETDLLAGVVRRHSAEVQTKGKIEHLAKITVEDCKFVDEMMTTYSRYEHSQSDEAPVDLPLPDEIEKDLNAIVGFIETVQKRKES